MGVTLEQFVQHLTQSGLMSATEVISFQDTLPPPKPRDAETLARELVQASKLTRYQAQSVYQGKTKGLVFGEYRALDKLGQGGMGIVLKAEHRRMKRLVAVKMIAGPAMKSPDAVKRFYREVEAAAKLNHPNIVQAYDASQQEGVHYLVMEYVEGKDLAAIVKEKGPLPVAQAVECIVQAARGLEYAHKQGIIHRDIKPANLLVDKEGTVKILDMGLARVAGLADQDDKDRLTASGQVMGTCDYMAPEQARDTHHADRRADIYSLGCTLYRLLTNETLYKGESLVQILLGHQHSPIPSLRQTRSDVSPQLDATYRKMVAKKTEDRQQTMAEVIADLERCTGKRSGVMGSLADQPVASDQAMQDAQSFLQGSPGVGAAAIAKKKPTPSQSRPIAYQPGQEADQPMGLPQKLLTVAREKPVPAALVALGLVGVVVVALFAVTIRIRHPDGKETIVEVPDGSEIEVSVKTASGRRKSEKKGAVRKSDTPPPLAKPKMLGIEAAQVQKQWAAHLGVKVEETNSIGMPLVLIPPGEFEMGSTPEEVKWALEQGKQKNPTDKHYFERVPSEAPRHRVKITEPFYLGMHQVTQGEYEKVMGINPSAFTKKHVDVSTFKPPLSDMEAKARVVGVKKVQGKDTRRHPVETVSWDEAMEFCRSLSAMPAERAARRVYRLPTEAEWEYACRAGTATRWYCGDDEAGVVGVAWFNKNAGGMTHPVGEKKPNAWGLYDMHGNVWQWCGDWYSKDFFAEAPPSGPEGTPAGSSRVLRGGSWSNSPFCCRSAYRNSITPAYRGHNDGFRVVLVR